MFVENQEKKGIAAEALSPDSTKTNVSSDLKNMSLDELHILLQQVLDQEDYVLAITIRDEINSREK
jgi:protein-arginine kinase activator protein McsA